MLDADEVDGINEDHVDDVLLLLERELHNDDDNERMDAELVVEEEADTVDDEARFNWRCLPDNSLADDNPFCVRSISGTI